MDNFTHSNTQSRTFQPSTRDKVLVALEAYDLKEEKPNQYRCNSPLRSGSNSHGFTVTFDDDEHGAYLDHVSQESGSLYDLAKRLGIELPQRVKVENTKIIYAQAKSDLNKGFKAYAEAQGIDESILLAAGIEPVIYENRPAVAITTETGLRYRFLDTAKKAYKSPAGYQNCWFGLTRAIKMATQAGLPLFYCNGPISVVVAQYFHVPAITLAGGGEVPKIKPLMLAKLKQNYTGPIWIVLDCDKTGRTAALGIKAQLEDEGYQVRALDLMLTDKGDLADLCRVHSENVLAALQKLPDLVDSKADQTKVSTKTSEKPDLLNAAETWATQYSDKWLFDVDAQIWRNFTGTHWKAQIQQGPLDILSVNVLRSMSISVSGGSRMDGVIRIAAALCPHTFNSRAGLVNFSNGTLDLNTLTLREHERTDDLVYCLPYEYQIGIYPAIEKALQEIIPDPVGRAAYMTHIGLALISDMNFHKALLLYGPRRSGKSSLLDLAVVTCGQERGSYADKWLFSNEVEGMWARADFHDERLAAIDELSVTALRDGEDNFKKMAAHGGVSMRYMRQMQVTDNRWSPKILMATNDAPRYRDSSGALTERLVIISCPSARPDQKQDQTLFKVKLLPEIPTFAAACIQVALATIKTGLYPESPTMRALRGEIENQGDSVKAWAADRTVFDPTVFGATDTLYADFLRYCSENGLTAMSKNQFSQALTNRFSQLAHSRQRVQTAIRQTKSIRGLQGIRLRRTDDPDSLDDPHDPQQSTPISGCGSDQESATDGEIQESDPHDPHESRSHMNQQHERYDQTLISDSTQNAKTVDHVDQIGQKPPLRVAKHDDPQPRSVVESSGAAGELIVSSITLSASEQATLKKLNLTPAEREVLQKLAQHAAQQADGSRAYFDPGHLLCGISPIADNFRHVLKLLHEKEFLEYQPQPYGGLSRITQLGYVALTLPTRRTDLRSFLKGVRLEGDINK